MTLRLALGWTLCLTAASIALAFAWTNLDDPRRIDGNGGHVNVDFAGQWMLGRMLLAGHPSELYDRLAHHQVLAKAYPNEPQIATEPHLDRERLANYLLGKPDESALETLIAPVAPFAADNSLTLAILIAGQPPADELVAARRTRQLGGPLYPPIQAYLMAPLALMPPALAYRTVQLLNLALAFLLGLGASRWSAGRLTWPEATLMLMLFPGFAGTINLGQNPLLSLGLLGLGWWLVSVGRPGWGGVAWGLLAFKPVWAVPFFLVALLTRRFRMTLSMAATGALLILMTLPAGGLRPWFDWLEMGQIASALYARDRNWVLISRDVQNLPRRVLLQFPDGPGRATSPYGDLPDRLGVGLLALIGLVSAVLLWRMPTPSWSGQAGCFTLLSGWLLGWHFMYYDSLLAALPVFVLLLGEDPRGRRIGWLVWVLLVIGHYAGEWFDSKTLGPPTDTLLLLALWLASGAASARRWFSSRDPF